MSNIDVTVPVQGTPTTQSVRDNFQVAATEIDAATALANGKLSDAPSDGNAYGRLSAQWQQVLPLAGGQMNAAIRFGSVAASSPTNLAHHLDLFGGTFGFCVTSARLNIVVPAGSSAWINAGGIDAFQVTPTVINAMVGIALAGGALDSAANSFANHISLFGTGYGIGVTAGQINIVSTNRVCFIDQAGNTVSMQVSRTGVIMNVAATGVAPGVGDNSAAIPTTAWCTAAFAPHAALDALQAQIDAMRAALAANNINV
jgi:hypothetical protein